MNRNKLVYFIGLFFCTAATTIPHSILTIILLGKGLNLSNIAFIQSMYSLAIIICEFPSGVLSDLFSRKIVYLLALVVQIISFSIIIFKCDFLAMSIAWFMYGVATALDSGTLESEIIVNLKREKLDILKFMGHSRQLGLVSAIIGSGIGFFSFSIIGINIYYISLVCLGIAFLVVSIYFRSNKFDAKQETSILTHLKELCNEIKTKPQIKYLIYGKGIFQVFLQVHFQFWQAILLYRNMQREYFYIFYLAFQCITILAYKINIKKIKHNYLMIAEGSFLVLILGLQLEISNIIFWGIYFFVIFFMFVINYLFDYMFNTIIDINRISSLVSLMSSISRVFAFCTLVLIGVELKYLSITSIFILHTIISLGVILLIFYKLRKEYRWVHI